MEYPDPNPRFITLAMEMVARGDPSLAQNNESMITTHPSSKHQLTTIHTLYTHSVTHTHTHTHTNARRETLRLKMSYSKNDLKWPAAVERRASMAVATHTHTATHTPQH